MSASVCSIDECEKLVNSRRLCSMHYQRWRKYGDVTRSAPFTVEERFWSKVDKSGDCWEWTGVRNEFGYGQINVDGKSTKAHRFSWLLAFGEIPAEKPCVLHRCDNPPCVRPDHLFVGTQQDNVQDMVAKGRGALQRPGAHKRGLDNPRGKLTDFDVAVIRALEGWYTSHELGPIFRVGAAHIRLLWSRTRRAHVEPASLLTARINLIERTAA